MEKSTVRFDEALELAVEFVRRERELLGDVVIVRDLAGRPRIVHASKLEPTPRSELARRLHDELGAYSPGERALLTPSSELLAAAEILDSPDLRFVDEGLRVLERQLMTGDWMRGALPDEPPQVQRAAFFGVKGGVGRSTALVVLARHLAERDLKVLVLDLDLESPGVSATLLPADQRPAFGVVDWFVETNVGQGDESLLREMVASSPLAAGTGGAIRVVPAGGSQASYLAKLSRAYGELGGAGSFAERVARLVDELERLEQPDVVLLDCRTGIHDLAATAVTRLGALSFLFAIDTSQTWFSYELLFRAWRDEPTKAASFRNNLQIVAALVPETGREEYVERLRERAFDLFVDHLYEEETPETGERDLFTFGLDDKEAPHRPIPIYWGREFQEFDPVVAPRAVTPEQIRAAYGPFLDHATAILTKASVTT